MTLKNIYISELPQGDVRGGDLELLCLDITSHDQIVSVSRTEKAEKPNNLLFENNRAWGGKSPT